MQAAGGVGEADITAIKRPPIWALVTVTGGLALEDLPLLKAFDPCLIAGVAFAMPNRR